MIIRSLFAAPARQALQSRIRSIGTRFHGIRPRHLLLAAVTAVSALAITACTHNLYQFPLYNFAGRPVPPSSLAQRVLVGVTFNGSNGGLIILDGLRDLRGNLMNTVQSFSISGYSGGYPSLILNYPEQTRGYVYSNAAPYAVGVINYSTESSSGAAGPFGGALSGLAIAPDFRRFYAAVPQNGQLVVTDNTAGTYPLNLPDVYKVAVNSGDTVALAMVRNSDTLYRVVKLNNGSTAPPGATDCEPQVLPQYCVVPVPGTYDRPYDAIFSPDGSQAYVLNCGQECGGGSHGGAGLSIIPQGALQINLVPTSTPYPAVVTQTVPIPGGVTTAVFGTNTLYAAGQQLQPDGLYAGRLTPINLATLAVGTSVPISDGTHTKLLFADDNTLWIGSQFCASGERVKLGLNYNCLTRYDLGTGAATIVPAITNGSLPYPNQDGNLTYYGSLTGICWVQNYHKVYTAYGGQVHAFNTKDGTEINNTNITVQGTALDVAYMDALTNQAN